MIFNTESCIQPNYKSNKNQGELRKFPSHMFFIRKIPKDAFPQNVDKKKKEVMWFRKKEIHLSRTKEISPQMPAV